MGSSARTTVFVDGMTCSACERRIALSLEKLDGVIAAKASMQGGKVDVDFESGRVTIEDMKRAIEKAGYTVRDKKNSGTLAALGIGIVLSAVYLAANGLGLFNAIPMVDASISYGMLFVVGLLTSVHCIAMCGGIALSQSVSALGGGKAGRDEEKMDRLARLRPGLLYNGGRIVSYTVMGALVGSLGSVFDFSPAVKGFIAGVAGLFMLLLGVKMLGIRIPGLSSGIPPLSRFVPVKMRTMFGRLSGFAGRRGPFAVGLLNVFIPCGPLQTMQLYALGTGSFMAGALSMFIFSVGTVPLMLTFSMAAIFLPRRFIPIMVKASAVIVMFLGVVTFGRAAALAGLVIPGLGSARQNRTELVRTELIQKELVQKELVQKELIQEEPSAYRFEQTAGANALPVQLVVDKKPANGGPAEAKVENGTQSVLTVFGSNNFVPIIVKAGVPLKWTIRIAASDLNGCNNAIVIPGWGIKKKLVPGDNIIEFTPVKAGALGYSCWMGMIRSKITVTG